MQKFTFLFSILFIVYFVGCGSNSDTDYYDSAMQKLDEGNPEEALVDLQKITDEFPESPIAPESLMKMAEIYQNKLIKNIPDDESFRKSSDLFFSVYKKYPTDDKAPLSLFMSAFILANELKDFSGATDAYNLFIEKYPSHELVSSAKQELENMGLSPEEVLQKQLMLQ